MRFGIDSVLGRAVTKTLVLFMVLQPVYVAFGMELENGGIEDTHIENTEGNALSSTTSDNENSSMQGGSSDTETSVEGDGGETVNDDGGSDFDTGTTADHEEDASGEVVSIDAGQDDGGVTDTGGVHNDGTNSDTGDEYATSTDEGTTATTSDDGTSGTSTETVDTDEEVNDDESAVSTSTTTSATSTDETASTTDEAVEPVVPIAQNSENKYVFGEGDCTLVADGEFYCVAGGVAVQPTGDPRVYAEKDREGDREIFFFDGVEVKRITNNAYDDFAPAFDEETQRIVWQAMISDRSQIMVFELPTNTTRQITTGRENSSNPDILGDTVVWQEWIDTNWEIMSTDVNNDGAPFEVERLTDNAVHDMFPQMYDDLVTWQSERGSSWEVIVYDLHTGKRHALEKNEDTKYENPRFVLLFDSKHDNGDVETIGYDLDSGEMMELGTKANPQPVTPASPKNEAPEAPPREATSTMQLKTVREDANGTGDM